MGLTRRTLLLGLGVLPWYVRGQGSGARVVIVGGGFAGATAARYLRLADPTLDVRLIEPRLAVHTCPFSNHVLGGLRDLASLRQDFTGLTRLGVQHVRARAVAVDRTARHVRLDDGSRIGYDRLMLAPGIDFRWGAIDGYGPEMAERVPHAWQAGPQTALLWRQLQAMDDGGTVLIGVPDNPYRCPPGPYERASLIAHYLTRHKPRSKVLILDAKDSFSKQALFQQAWAQRYPGRVEWVGRSDDGRVMGIARNGRELHTEFGGRHRGAVINLIPPQRAGAIAIHAGLTDDSGWVPLEATTFRTRADPCLYVAGDAGIAAPMPKSAYCANAQAKVAVAALLADLAGQPAPEPHWHNVCYSLLAPERAVSVAAGYRVEAGRLVEVAGTAVLSPLDAPDRLRIDEAERAQAWYRAIRADAWGAE